MYSKADLIKVMDLLEVNENSAAELITERNISLPPILSSLGDVDNCAKLLDNLKLCTKYLPTYTLSDINQELLQHVLPAVKKSLLKVYDDNFLLSDTVEDEFVLKILTENLQVAVGFIQFIKTILEFLSQNGEINLSDLNDTPVNLAQLISSTFEHCKNSTDVYKQSFNAELLELFRITQEVHLLFLKLFELYVVVKSESNDANGVRILTEVLDIICGMNEMLSELNIKSMSDNWKGYAAVANKFSTILIHSIDLKLPVLCLCYEVNKNLTSIEHKDEIDIKLVIQLVKITSFLIKVALKICDTFWSHLDRAMNEIIRFCCTVYSFPVDLYRSQGHPPEVLELIETLIFKMIEPLLLRLMNKSQTLKIFSTENLLLENNPFGLLNVLNNVLRVLTANQINTSGVGVDGVINTIFNSVRLCFAEFFWESEHTECFFDSLVLHISATVILNDERYGEVERILLKNLVQEHFFAALLAMEVWTLLLSNSSPQFCTSTLIDLIGKYQEIDFGILTRRPERIYFECFIQRVFKMLPNYAKNDFVLRYNPIRGMECWRAIQFESFPIQQRLSIEGVCMATAEKVEAMGRGNSSFKDVAFVAENLGALSTVNFAEIGLDPKNLVKAVVCLWGFNMGAGDVAGNSIFKYFMAELCKITGALGLGFNGAELATVLSQLRILSSNDSYKLLVCDILSVLSNRPSHSDLKPQTMTAISDIICQNLLVASSKVIRQEALEVIHNFAIKGRHELVRNILRSSRDMQDDISQYLQRQVAATKFDKEYLALLANVPFQHVCVKWRSESDFPKFKRLRFDDRPVGELGVRKKEPLVETQVLKPSKWISFGEIAKADHDENKHDGDVADVIGNIKGEVKCLVGVLKTEKLTAKNASDIRQIANQLLSLL